MGYWKDWRHSLVPTGSDYNNQTYYTKDVAPMTHVNYAFLTIAKMPNPESPQPCRWDGKAIYENMAATDVTKVMPKTDPTWKNQFEWDRKRIQALMDEVHAQGKKFVWSIGGWSDCTETLDYEKVESFADHVV
jgi:endo-chitodextinase